MDLRPMSVARLNLDDWADWRMIERLQAASAHRLARRDPEARRRLRMTHRASQLDWAPDVPETPRRGFRSHPGGFIVVGTD